MKSILQKHRARVASAFTIVELLVAITITAAITTLMVTIVINVLNVWSRSSSTLTVGNQARTILDSVAADLQGAVLRSSSDVMLAATIPQDQTVTGDAQVSSADWDAAYAKPGDSAAPNGSLELNPADRDLASYRFGHAGVWLRLFTIPPDNSSTDVSDLSAPRAVSYQIVRKQVGSSSAPYTYQLFRAEVRPFKDSADINDKLSTFEQGYDLFGANGYNDPDNNGNGCGLDGTLRQGDPGMIRRPSAAFVLGNGVIDFGVRIFTKNSTGILEEAFPIDRRGGGSTVRRVFAATTNTSRIHPGSALAANFTALQTSYGYPAVVEVMIRILTPDGVEIMQAYEADPSRFGGSSPSKWWELAEANSKVFTRRIEVRSTVL